MRTIQRIVFWGATGQAIVLNECLSYTHYKLVALFDNNPELNTPIPRCPLYIGEAGFQRWIKQQKDIADCGFVVAIGGNRARERMAIFKDLQSAGLTPVTIQHPTAFKAENAVVGEGSQLLAQSAVCVKAILGRNCIVNTGASIDHECVLGDAIHIGPGAHIAGEVRIKSFVMIGIGATVLPRIEIGEYSLVGAGAVVTKDVPANSIVMGNPARIARERIS